MVVTKNKDKKIQKNRFFKKPKMFKLSFGDSGIVSTNEGRIEFVQLSLIKKIIKLFIKKKKSNVDIIREKIWYFGTPNFYIQKKSKNSRMGKGKGLIERKVIRVRRGFVLFEFLGVPTIKLKKLILKINKFLDVKFTVIKQENIYFSLWSKKNKYIYYHDKYLIS